MSQACIEECCTRAMHLPSCQITPMTKQILASSLGSAASVLLLNPLSVIKVSLQNSAPTAISSSTAKSTVASAIAAAESKTIVSVVRNVYHEHGWKGFWGGTRLGLFQSLPNTVIYMALYERIKESLSQLNSSATPGIAGGLARFCSVTIIAPVDLMRTIQTGGSQESISIIAKNIYSKSGIRGFYAGWGSSVMRDVPFSMIYWFTFDMLRPHVHEMFEVDISLSKGKRGDDATLLLTTPMQYGTATTFVTGAMSGIVSAFVTHPFDVIKTQQQLLAAAVTPKPTDPLIVIAVEQPTKIGVSDIVRQNGVLSLFRGLSMRLLIVIPASAIMVTIYEAVKSI